jgi:hypothetical protein
MLAATPGLSQSIEDLLNNIPEGRKVYKETQHIRDKFEETCALRSQVDRRRNELDVQAGGLEEPAKSEALAESKRLTTEHTRINDEATLQWVAHNDSLASTRRFRTDLLSLLDTLPLTDEWDRYSDEIKKFESRLKDHTCWADPPGHQALNRIEMRLEQMLSRAHTFELSPVNPEVDRGQKLTPEVSLVKIAVEAPTADGEIVPEPPQVIKGCEEDKSGQSAIPRLQRTRVPDLQLSAERIALVKTLRRELAAIAIEILNQPTLHDLREKFPEFRIWRELSGPEQEDLLKEAFKPLPYAKTLALRHFGVTSAETLKKDRKKLKAQNIAVD